MPAKKKKGSVSPPSDPVDFEKAIEEVEGVVRRLESGDLGLSESLAEYENGIAKIKLCHKVLEQAERRIAVLTQVEEDGTPVVEPVDFERTDESSTAAKGAERTKKKAPKKQNEPETASEDPEGLF